MWEMPLAGRELLLRMIGWRQPTPHEVTPFVPLDTSITASRTLDSARVASVAGCWQLPTAGLPSKGGGVTTAVAYPQIKYITDH